MTRPNRTYGEELLEKRKAYPDPSGCVDAGLAAYRAGARRRDNPHPLSRMQEANLWSYGWDIGYHTEEPIHPDVNIAMQSIRPVAHFNGDGTWSPMLVLEAVGSRDRALRFSQHRFPSPEGAAEFALSRARLLQDTVNRIASEWNLEPIEGTISFPR